MNCHSCGSRAGEDARFCARCGARLIVICPSCAAENAGDSAFCHKCGTSIEASAPAAAAVARGSLEPVLRSRTMLQGERKEITVLFADISGSTEIVAGLDPEQAMARLDGVIRAMTAAVRRYGGFDRPQGDGIMALFGAPLADQDHAARGCLAALAMQRAVAELGEGITIRVGIHSGPVVVRSIRTGAATDFDAIGETVHLAARMEQAAESGTIRITGETCRLAKDFIHVRALGTPPVKGITLSIEQFELLDRTTLRTLWDARASSRLTPFVGRHAEFAALRLAASETLAGTGRMVLVSGDPGTGKSRLVHEFLREFRTDSWVVLRSGAMPFSLNAPHAMVAMLLSAWLGLDERGVVPAERLQQSILGWQDAGRWTYPALTAVLDLPIDDPDWRALDSESRRRYTLDAVMSWVASLCRDRALLLVFEDLQWADSESAAIIAMLAKRAASLPLLIVGTRRSGEAGGLVQPEVSTSINLKPLEPQAAEQMLVHLLGPDPELASLQRFIVEKTGGVPFFLEETTRSLSEMGALDDTVEGYRQRVKIDDIRVPSNVRLVLASRIDRLPPGEKELLHVAAVIGHEMSRDILQPVADLPEAEVEARVIGLERAGFLRREAAGLVFEHMLTREVAYETLLLSRRKTLHRSVLEAMERRSGEQAHLLAYHAFHAELWSKALHYLLQAANRALDLSAYTEAVRLLEQALEALTHLPRSPEFLTRSIDVRLAMRAALAAPSGDLGRIRQYVGEAKAIALEIGDHRRLGAIALSEAAIHNQLGDCEGAISAGRLAQSIAEKLDDAGLSISARIFIGQAHLWRGDHASARSAFDADLDWRTSEHRHRRFGTTGTSSILSLHVLASANAFAGDFTAAEKFAEDATSIAAEGGRPYDLVHAAWCRGWALSYRGAMSEGQRLLEEALRLCETMQVRYFLPVVAAALGSVHVENGRFAEGAALLTRALATQQANALPYGEAWSSGLLALARLREGDCEAAASLASCALDLAATHGYGTVEVMAERVFAAAVGRLGRPSEADQHFARAVARAEALGLRPELAHCHLERGLLLRDLQRADEARGELELARRLYAEMGMEFWREKAAALDGLGGAVRQ